MLFAGRGKLLFFIFLRERERESCWSLSGLSGLSTGSRRFFIFFLPWSDIFALLLFYLVFFLFNYFILLRVK
jgi:hypothetical protein